MTDQGYKQRKEYLTDDGDPEQISSKMSRIAMLKPLLLDMSPLHVSISDLLSGVGVCCSCVLRYLGNRDLGIHASIDAQPFVVTQNVVNEEGHEFREKGSGVSEAVELTGATEVKHEVPEETQQSPEIVKCICPACLGLLQTDYADIANQGFEVFKSKGYNIGTKSFVISAGMPAQLNIRQKSLTLYILDQLKYLPITPDAIRPNSLNRSKSRKYSKTW
jgi:hypothetical protein